MKIARNLGTFLAAELHASLTTIAFIRTGTERNGSTDFYRPFYHGSIEISTRFRSSAHLKRTLTRR